MTPFRSAGVSVTQCITHSLPSRSSRSSREDSHAGAVLRRATVVYSRVDRAQGALLLLAFGVLGVSVAAAFPPLHCLPI